MRLILDEERIVPESSLPVEFLFRLEGKLGSSAGIDGGPQGSRRIIQVTGGSFEGPRLRGTIEGPGGDWLSIRSDGTSKLDVRLTLKTDDGATIYMAYNGIASVVDGERRIRTAPLFETGDERYSWLNAVQAVGTGTSGGGVVSYDVYALK